MSGFVEASSAYASAPRSASYMIQPLMMAGTLEPDDETSKEVSEAFSDPSMLAANLYEFTEVSDPYGAAVSTCGPKPPNSRFGEYRSGYGGYHGGVDLSPINAHSGYCVWTLALFSGTVRESYYHNSWGRCIVIESDQVPGLYIRYAHLGPGNASSYGGSQPSWMVSLKYENGEAITGMGQSPTQYEKDNGYLGYNTTSSTWAGGSVLWKVGDHVNAGDRVGIFGTTGSSTGLHSHLEILLDVDATTMKVRGFEQTGKVPFVCYRTDAYSVIENGGFGACSWVLYVSKQKASPSGMTAQEFIDLMGADFVEEDPVGAGGVEVTS